MFKPPTSACGAAGCIAVQIEPCAPTGGAFASWWPLGDVDGYEKRASCIRNCCFPQFVPGIYRARNWLPKPVLRRLTFASLHSQVYSLRRDVGHHVPYIFLNSESNNAADVPPRVAGWKHCSGASLLSPRLRALGTAERVATPVAVQFLSCVSFAGSESAHGDGGMCLGVNHLTKTKSKPVK
jgi:hypothetical protein